MFSVVTKFSDSFMLISIGNPKLEIRLLNESALSETRSLLRTLEDTSPGQSRNYAVSMKSGEKMHRELLRAVARPLLKPRKYGPSNMRAIK